MKSIHKGKMDIIWRLKFEETPTVEYRYNYDSQGIHPPTQHSMDLHWALTVSMTIIIPYMGIMGGNGSRQCKRLTQENKHKKLMRVGRSLGNFKTSMVLKGFLSLYDKLSRNWNYKK